MQLCPQIFKPLHIMVTTMDIANPLSLPLVDSARNDLDDKEIITTVEGTISFISAYQQSQHASDYDYLNDIDQNGCQPRKKQSVSLFCSSRRKFDYSRLHNAILLDYCTLMLFMM